MIRTVLHNSLLLKILVLVFAMNATLGYGACCDDTDSAQAEVEMPCHDTDENTHTDHEKCCTACFVMVLPLDQVKPAASSVEHGVQPALILFISNLVAPPFKPPIARLS